MLSGAFILDNDKNAAFSYFYKKSFKKLFIPVLIFSILYFIWNYLIIYCSTSVFHTKHFEINLLIEPITKWLKGEPFYHLWYMYMLIGLYALAPVILRLKNDIGFERFEKLAIVFIILASIAAWTTYSVTRWNPGSSFCFLGYFMLGYVIRKKCSANNIKAFLFITLGILIEAATSYLRYRQVLLGIAEADQIMMKLFAPTCPSIVLASICIFTGFAYLNAKINCSYLAPLTFVFYMMHGGVLQVIQTIGGEKILNLVVAGGDTRISIPVMTLITVVVTVILTELYNRCWARIESRAHVSERLARAIWKTAS